MDLRDVVELAIQDNLTPGLRTAQTAMDNFTGSVDRQDAAIRRSTPTAEGLVRRLDAVTAAEARLEAATAKVARERAILDAAMTASGGKLDGYTGAIAKQNEILAAAEAGLIKARNAASSTAAASDTLAKSTANSSYQLKQIALQTPDIVQGLLGGQSAFQILLQQGGQITQVMGGVGAALRGVGSVLLSALASPAGAIAVAVGAFGALAYAADSSQRRLVDLQNTLRGTRDDYTALATTVDQTAKRLAASTSLGSGEARQAGAVIAAAPNFGGSQAQLEDLVKLSKDLAVAMGTDLADGAKRLAAALQDPGAEAQRLADGGLRSMSQALAYTIKLQAEAGDKAGAFAQVVGALRGTIGGAGEANTVLGTSLKKLSEAFTAAGQDGRSLAEVLGSAITNAAAAAVDAFTRLIAGVSGLRDTAMRLDAERSMRGASGGNASTTPDATGRPLLINPQSVNGENATGIFQVLPSTGRSMGYDVRFQDQNIAAGLQYLQQQSAARGSVDGGLAQYGGYGTNVGAASGYIAKVRGADIGKLPADVAAQIDYWGQVLGLPPDMIALGQRLAVVESGGRQYATPGTVGGAAASALPSAPAGRADLVGRGDMPGRDGLSASQIAGRGLSDQAFAAYRGSGVLSTQIAANSAQQQLLQAGIGQATANGDTERVAQLGEALAKTRGEAAGLITEQAKIARAAQDAVAPLLAEEGATRDLAAIRQKFVETARDTGRGVDQAALLSAQTAKLTELGVAFNDNLRVMDRSTAAQLRMNASLELGGVAAEHAQNAEKAVEDARKSFLPGTVAFTDAVLANTEARNRNTDALRDAAAAQDVNSFAKTIELTKTEMGLLTRTADERARELAIMQERLKLGLRYGEQATEEQQKALDAAAASASLSQQLQLQKSSLDAIGSSLSSAFDQVGTAITQAFVGGQGAAVNWGNVAKGAVTSVLQQVVKLAVLNPLFNAALGQSNPTLGAALSALGGGSTSTATGGGQVGGVGLSDVYQLGSTLNSASGALGGPTLQSALGLTGPNGVGSSISGLGQSLGLTGPNGAFSGVGSSITSGLNTTVIGTGTVGSLATGIGLGYGAGTFVNGLVRGNEQNGQIGAAGGAVAGAIIGSVVPVIGTVVGGLVGGLLGGTGGGLLGSKIHKAYGINVASNSDGFLRVESANNNHEPEFQAALQAQQQQIDQINGVLGAGGLRTQGRIVVGKGNSDPSGGMLAQAQNVSDEFSRLRFTADNGGMLGRAVSDRSFGSLAELQQTVTEIQAFQAALPDLISPLAKAQAGIGSFGEAVAAVNTTYDSAIAIARKYGEAEDQLQAGRATAIAEIRKQADAQVKAATGDWDARYQQATGNGLAANLAGFDSKAEQERTQFHDVFVGIFGPASEASADYVDSIAKLNKTLAAERKNIEDAQIDPARTNVAGVITSLTSYVRSLTTGALSALSPQDQYASTKSSFQRVGQAALAGDFGSLQDVQAYASDFLSTSRNLNGSGAQYASDFADVLALLKSISGADPDALTASAMAQIQQTATEKLGGALSGLGASVSAAVVVSGASLGSSFADYANATTIAAQAAAARAAEYNASLIAANDRATADGFASLTAALSTVGGTDLNTANFARVAQSQTDQQVAWLAAIRDQIYALRQEMQTQASAPAGFGSTYEGNNANGSGDRG